MPYVLSPAQLAALDTRVDAAPPLTPEQRARLRPLLAGTLPVPAARQAAA